MPARSRGRDLAVYSKLFTAYARLVHSLIHLYIPRRFKGLPGCFHSFPQAARRSTAVITPCIVVGEGRFFMRNGLYSIHINMLDGVKGRDSGVIILHDGQLLAGGPFFWSAGSYTVGKNGTWKGELTTNQHTPFADPFVRPLFGGNEVSSGFTGTFTDEGAEVFGTTLVGTKSMSFHATMKFLTAE
jgi:hypothetical protein